MEEKRSTQLVIVTGFIILYFIFSVDAFIYVALTVGVASLASSHAGDFIVYLWHKIAQVLGWINTRIILSVVFYAFLFPIALLSRISGKDPLKLKKRDRKSVFVERNHQYTKKDLRNPW